MLKIGALERLQQHGDCANMKAKGEDKHVHPETMPALPIAGGLETSVQSACKNDPGVLVDCVARV